MPLVNRKKWLEWSGMQPSNPSQLPSLPMDYD
jgi:hypothetical protein